MALLILVSPCMVVLSVKADSSPSYKLMFQNTFDSKENKLLATSSVAGTPIKKGFAMAQSYMSDSSGVYKGRVYCLNMGNHPYASKMDDSTNSKAWTDLGYKKREAIQNILALGLEGNLKGSSTDSITCPNYGSYPIENKARTVHYIYGNAKYGSGNFSDSEIYIAMQLLIWEITSNYRKVSSLDKTSKSLVSAYSNTHVKKVYDYIVDRLYVINQIPSFTVNKSNNPNIKTYNFKVTYDASKKSYSVSPSSRTIKSLNKNVLKHYDDLAQNKSIKFVNSATNETKYLNITATISGDSLVLKPNSTTPISNKSLTGYSTSTSATHSVEKDLPSSGSSVDSAIIAYSPSSGELANGQNQVGIKSSSCKIDPRNAYYKVSASFASENVDRDFTIQKDMRIKSETSASGVKSDNSSLDSMEEGYYYYVKLPTGATTYSDVENGKVVTKTAPCQNSETVLGLNHNDICYNKDLDEYYVIVGPTNSEGETPSVANAISKYVKANINETNMPYGNYYVFELGKRTKNVTDNSKKAYMTPSNYSIPDGVKPYHFSYEEHYAAKDSSLSAKRSDMDVSTDSGKVQYYNYLKRINRGASSSESISPTYVNLTSIPVRIHKTSDDNVTGSVAFKVEKKSGNNWVSVNLKNYIRDKSYGNYSCKLEDGVIVTYGSTVTLTDGTVREKGYTPYLDLPAGDYRITEMGIVDNSTGVSISMREYNKVPDPIVFNIGTDNSILDEFVSNKTIEYEVENSSSVQLRLFKEDENSKRLNGAEFALYSDTGLQLTTDIKTATQVIDGKSEDGVATVDGLQFGTYTLKETKAPDGYVLSDTEYTFTINQLGLRKGSSTKDGFYDFYNYTVTNEPTETYITKTDITDITGENVLAGAKLKVYPNGDSSNVIDEWVSTTEPHKIEGLVAGKTYVLEEVTPPNGYTTSNIVFFKVNEDGTPTKVTMKDDITSYQFIKQDDKGNILAGAKLQLSDDETKDVVAEWTTSDTPYTVSKLTVGKTYRLKELSAPSAKYKLADDITFTVKDTSEIQTITMTDEIYYGSVTIQKQDDEGNNIGGAEFELYKADGTKLSTIKNDDGKYSCSTDGTVTTLPTDSDGKLVIDNLELGDYYLIETKSPNGKMPYTDKIKFTILSENEESLNPSFTVKQDNVVIPSTGGYSVLGPLMVAFGIIIVSVGLSIYNSKKEKRRRKNEN